MIKTHVTILVACSAIGFTGHYLQFGVARLTPWIPAGMGLLILLVNFLVKNEKGLLNYLPLILVLAFGILTTNMFIRFFPQDFQPIRKKIIFGLMSASAWITIVYKFLYREIYID